MTAIVFLLAAGGAVILITAVAADLRDRRRRSRTNTGPNLPGKP